MCKPRNNNCEITVKQNYIHYNGLQCVQQEGLVVGAASASILLEICLLCLEDTNTIDIPAKHQISRYINDILFTYQLFSTNISKVLEDFNDFCWKPNFMIEDRKITK